MKVTEQKFHTPHDAPLDEYGKGRESWFFETPADPGLSLFPSTPAA